MSGRLSRRRAPTISGNRVRLFNEGGRAYDAMLAAIDAAERQVLLEMYWFASDDVGRRFADALAAAAARGVQVAVIYDAVGSIESDEAMFDGLRDAGARVVEFHPIKPWRSRFRLGRVVRRDHRKVLSVDAAVGFTGGVNIAKQWLDHDGVPGFRDDMVEIRGPAVAELASLFHEAWGRCGELPLTQLPACAPEPAGGVRVQVLGHGSLRQGFTIAREYRRRIGKAHHRVIVSNAYFLPTRKIQRALCHAAQRGVEVQVLLPRTPDIPAVRLASQATWRPLIEAGVEIHEYERGVLHSKSAVIDDEWSTVGTFNLDPLSLRFNREVNVAILDADFAKEMGRQFEEDLRHSRPVTLRDLDRRSLSERALSRGLFAVRAFL